MSVHIAYETPQDVQEQVYEMVKSLGKDVRGAIKRGANEVTKAAERGTAQMVVMAENVNPGELLAHIPMICKEKEILVPFHISRLLETYSPATEFFPIFEARNLLKAYLLLRECFLHFCRS